MTKIKKAAAVAVMVGGMALSGGVAHGDDHYSFGNSCTVIRAIGPDSGNGQGQDEPSDVSIGNAQSVKCNQDARISIPADD